MLIISFYYNCQHQMNTSLSKILTSDEKIIIETSPSRTATLISVALFVIIGFVLLFVLIGPIFWVFAVIYYVTEMSKIYVVTDKRVVAKEGILSPKVVSINLNQITDVTVKQNFGEHFIDNMGNIHVNTAGTGTHELVMQRISNPYGILQKINELRA